MELLSSYNPTLINGSIRLKCIYRENHPVSGYGAGLMSAFIYKDGGILRYKCFSCGKYTPAYFALKRIGMPLKEMLELSKNFSNKERLAGIPTEYNLGYSSNPPKVLIDRGFSPEILSRFKIGELDEAICVPLYSYKNEHIANYLRIGRTFWYDPPTSKDYFYFPLIVNNDDTIFIAEGLTDALRLAEFGYNSIPMFGTQLSDKSAGWICSNFKKVYIATDADSAGESAIERIYNLLKHRVAINILLITRKDVEKYSLKDSDIFHDIVETAPTYFQYKMLKKYL